MRAPAGIELLPDGTWDCGSTGGEWSPGGCGCGSGGSCGCKGEVGSCGGKKSGGGGQAPRLPDYDGEIWAIADRSSSNHAMPGSPRRPRRVPTGIELLPGGTWDCGSTGGEWSPGGCGCGSGGECGCGGSCGGCSGEGGCGGKPGGTGEVPHLPDYNGEIWASSIRSTTAWETVGQVLREVPEVCCCVPALGKFLCGEDVGGGRIWRRPGRYPDNTGTHYCGEDRECLAIPLPGRRPTRATWPAPCPPDCLAKATSLQIACSHRMPECEANLGVYDFMCKLPYPMCPGIAVPPPPPPKKPPRDPGYDPNIDWCSEPFLSQEDVGDDINYCCYLHDKCYEAGGNEASRTRCDQELAGCIFEAAGVLWSFPYFVGVSIFGSSHFNYTMPEEEGEMDRVFGSPWGR